MVSPSSPRSRPFKDTSLDDGWISIHRKIREHWIWQDARKFQWWMDLLLEANHKSVKVVLGFDLVECGRGQSIRSLRGWADRWGVSKDSARHFLSLLKKDGMIEIETLAKTTRITICNYDNYQQSAHEGKTETRQRRDRGKTETDLNNNDNNVNNVNNDKKALMKSIDSLAKDIFLLHYKKWVDEEFPYWDGKEAGNLNKLLKKLKKITEEYRKEKITDVDLLDALDVFLTKIGLLADEFIMNNFTPSYFNSAFNKLITNIRNGNNIQFRARLRQARSDLKSEERIRGWAELLQFAGDSASKT